MTVYIKRVYDEPAVNDGFRVLVDRLWPRGVSRDKAKLSAWLKEIGPSNELRKWFGHDPAKFGEFKKRYQKELAANSAFTELEKIVKENQTVTLLYSAHDTEHNQAVVVKDYLEK